MWNPDPNGLPAWPRVTGTATVPGLTTCTDVQMNATAKTTAMEVPRRFHERGPREPSGLRGRITPTPITDDSADRMLWPGFAGRHGRRAYDAAVALIVRGTAIRHGAAS